jgi:nucleotide-binding universal stress UspA family protein
MIPFRRILFPVDYSNACRATIPYVEEMVRLNASELILLHAYEPPGYGLVAPGIPAEDVQALEEQRLAEFAKGFPRLSVRPVVQAGDPVDAIRELVRRDAVDLVMMPTHGQSGFRRLLLGSVTGKVLQEAEVPVWTGTHAALEDHIPRIPCRSVVCAVGPDAEAALVLRLGSALARSFGAKLSVVSVVETLSFGHGSGLAATAKENAAYAERELQRLKSNTGVDAPVAVMEGDISSAVRQEALDCKADLVVAGRGAAHGAFTSCWSHLYGIIRESPCPVLSV